MDAHAHVAMADAGGATVLPAPAAMMHHGAELTWRPTLDGSDCRMRGLVLHTLLMGSLAMCVLPHALAARHTRRFLVAAAALFAGACASNALQRTCTSHGGHSALHGGNLHAVLGWLFVACIAALSLAATYARAGAAGDASRRASVARAFRAADGAALRASTARVGLPVRLRGWALTASCVMAALLPLTGVWSTLNCYESPGFIGYEIGTRACPPLCHLDERRLTCPFVCCAARRPPRACEHVDRLRHGGAAVPPPRHAPGAAAARGLARCRAWRRLPD